jgi:thiamine-monophosphate kinase
MMDLSDGLAADVPRLAFASDCGVVISPETVPCHSGCSLIEACCDGEDFELLLAVAPEKVASLKSEWEKVFPHVLLTTVGFLTEPGHGCTPKEIFKKGGYDHFQ